jgi:hypothetical protein
VVLRRYSGAEEVTMANVPINRRRILGPAATKAAVARIRARIRQGKKGFGRDLEDGGVPAIPDRPRDLSGGAAAAFDFGDE